MTARKFCIITTARCGSNALMSMLRLAPNVICHGELFNKSGVWSAPQFAAKVPSSVPERDRDPVAFLSQVEHLTLEHAGTFGFKLFLAHSRLVREHVIASGEYKILLLSRRNTLAQFSSLEAARASGVWHTRKSGAADSSAPLVFDKQKFEEYRHWLKARYDMVTSELAAAGRAYLPVEYSNIKNDDAIRTLADFLGMDNEAVLSLRKGRIPQVKQGSPVILHRFSNPQDVIEAMRDIGHEDWLNEGEQPSHV